MLVMQRITTTYSSNEDRIRVSGEAVEGGVAIVWLTQRLLRLLVPVLVSYIESRGEVRTAPVLQSFEQQVAVAELEPLPPVDVGEGDTEYLPNAVEIQKGDAGVLLEFLCPKEQRIAFELATTSLRQWLAILHNASVQAEWPLEVWPSWIHSSEASGQASANIQ